MGDQNYDPALAAQPAQHVEECGQLDRRQQSGGLVEDQYARLEAERAQDFHPHPLSHRTLLHPHSRRRQHEAQPRRHRTGARRHLFQIYREFRAIRARGACAEAAQREILLPRHTLEQHRALMHRGDAGRQRGGGRARAERAAEQLDRTRVGAEPPGQDVHQRGLAGAVFAEQRHDLAGAGVEIDAVERE